MIATKGDMMATEEQKKLRQLRLFNNLIFGFAKGLYDLFGESMLATTETIGEDLLEEFEHELGLEVHGEDPEAILTEIERLLMDEYGLVKDITLDIDEGSQEIKVVTQGCLLWRATESLKAVDVPPYTCVPMSLATAALRKRLGKKAKFVSLDQNYDEHVCSVTFRLYDK
jgi:hypothetical protein